MVEWCLHASLFLGDKDMFKSYKRFDFWHVQTADIGGTKPWKNNCSLIWKLFKFLMTLLAGLFEMRGCWHIGLRGEIASHFVPRSFRTYFWSFRTYFLVISYPVTTISYPGHFVPSLVISDLGQLGTKWLYGGQFVPKTFRTLFGHFVPILVISYPAKMDGLTNGLTDRRVLIEITN